MVTEHDNPRPPWSSRLLAVACYLGMAPLLSLVGRWRNDAYFRHHRQQALFAALLLLSLFVLVLPTCFALETYLVRRYPHVHFPNLLVIFLLATFLPGLGLWGLLSVVGIGMALAGSRRVHSFGSPSLLQPVANEFGMVGQQYSAGVDRAGRWLGHSRFGVSSGVPAAQQH